MRGRLGLVVPSLVLAVGPSILGTAACTRQLAMEKLEGIVKAGLVSSTGLPVETVKCPESREQKAGDVFDCTALTKGGARVTVTVSQKDDEGNVAWKAAETKGVIDLRKLETEVGAGLKAQTGIDARVECGPGTLREAEPGKTFDCRATDPRGETVGVTITMRELSGKVDWRLNLESPEP